jgi:hypothetical protein
MNVLLVRTIRESRPSHRSQSGGQARLRGASPRAAEGHPLCVMPPLRRVTSVAVLELDDGVDNPLPALPEFRAFQEHLKNWMAEPPISEPVTVIGSYRFFSRRVYSPWRARPRERRSSSVGGVEAEGMLSVF